MGWGGGGAVKDQTDTRLSERLGLGQLEVLAARAHALLPGLDLEPEDALGIGLACTTSARARDKRQGRGHTDAADDARVLVGRDQTGVGLGAPVPDLDTLDAKGVLRHA